MTASNLLVIAAIALCGLWLSGAFRGKRIALPSSLSPSPTSLTDDALSIEYARRVKEKVEAMKTREVLENIHKIAAAQFTPISSALPAEVNHHPAAKPAEPPKNP